MEEKSFTLIYLDPETVRFERHGDTLSLTLTERNGETRHYPRVVLRSCFPVSNERTLLSVRDASAEEQAEIGIIEDWAQLSEENQWAIAAELNLYYFVPRIKQVLKVKDELGFLYWTVETDKGSKEFVMQNSITRCTREMGAGHWLLIDVNDVRYEIPDVNALDRASRGLVQRHLYI
jgi:hypothetical protein